MRGAARARMEQKLAVAHRQLWLAKQAAEDLNSQGDIEDLEQLLREVTRIANASLSDRNRRAAA